MQIILNGKQTKIQGSMSVTDLIKYFQLDPRWVIAELNGQALLKEEYSKHKIKNGDKVELVKPVAGG